jgi:GNAT superfamily N-acetyltransferase
VFFSGSHFAEPFYDAVVSPLIRAYESRDFDAVSAIIEEYRAEGSDSVVDRSALARALEAFDGAEHRLLVAEQAGAVVGYVACHHVPFPMLQGAELYVSDLFVKAAARGGGIGSALLRAVEEQARERGCVRLMLNNGATSAAYQRRFYPQHDFRERRDFATFVKLLQD